MAQRKSPKQLERHFKGMANHWRIKIVRLLAKRNGLTLDEITWHLDANFKTMSEHTRKLVQAGLLEKTYKGRAVLHSLSPCGKVFHDFARRLDAFDG